MNRTQSPAMVKERTPARAVEKAAAHSGREASGASAGGVPSIQQAAGNLAVQHLFRAGAVKPKLEMSRPGDPDEQEADRVADKVVSPAPAQPRCADCAAGQPPCAACQAKSKLQRKPLASAAPVASPGRDAGAAPVAGSGTRSPLAAFRGGGLPLSPGVRSFFEPRFGRDFGNVRVHTGNEAADNARAIGARAFAYGPDIAFNTGEFSPATPDGKRLLAHELAHVAAGDSSGKIRRQVPNAPTPPAPKAPANTATLKRITEINNNVWVGYLDELELERLWNSYGDALPDVYRTAEGEKEWHRSIKYGASLWKIKALDNIRNEFKRSIGAVARGYLNENRDLAVREKTAIGPDANTAPTPDQINAIKERRDAAERIKAARRAEAGLRMLHVGYDRVPGKFSLFKSECNPIANEPGGRTLATKPFNPLVPPQIPPRGDEAPCGKMPPWAQTKAMWERLEGVIDGLTTRYPALYALARDLNEEKVAPSRGGTEADSRALMLKALNELLAKIAETDPKLNTDFVLQLKPVHQTLMGHEPWDKDFRGMVATETLKGHENDEFWTSLGLSTLAAGLFIVATLATGGLAAVLFGASLGLSAGVAANSVDRFLSLRGAQRTSLSPGTELVTSGQVNAALVTAVLDTVFVFLDAFSAGKAIGAGAEAAATLGERVLPKTLAEAEQLEGKAAQKTLGDIASKDAAQVEKQLAAGASRGVSDEALKKAGYVLEVEIVEGGEKHLYRRLKDGSWCRFSVRVCGIQLPGNVEKLAARAAEAIENPAAAALRTTLESTAHEAAHGIASSSIGKVVGTIGRKFPVVKSLTDGAVQRVVRAAYAELAEGGLRKSLRALSSARGQLLEEIANARIANLIKTQAGRTELGLGHITEELIYINGSRVKDAAGQQFTDGIIAIRRGDSIQIVSIVESKAGEFAAGKLASSFNSLKRASPDNIREAIRDFAPSGRASAGLMPKLRKIDPELAKQILDPAVKEVDKARMLAAIEQLSDADIIALKKSMGSGEGQIAKSTERAMEDATNKGLTIDGKPVKVEGRGRPSMIGVTPKDVVTAPLQAELKNYSVSFLDLKGDAATTAQLNEIAGDIVRALGPELETAAKAAK